MNTQSYKNVSLFRFVLALHVAIMGSALGGLWLAERYGFGTDIFSDPLAGGLLAVLIVPALGLLPLVGRVSSVWAWRSIQIGFVGLSLVGISWLLNIGTLPGWLEIAALAWPVVEGVLLFSPPGILITSLAVVVLAAANEAIITAGSPDLITVFLRILAIVAVTFFAALVIGYLKREETRSEVGRQDTQAVLESMKDGLLVVDASNRLQYANPKAIEYLGVDVKKLVGTQVEEKKLKKDGHENLATILFYSATSAGHDDEGEINEVVIEKPATRILRVTSVPVRGADERLQGFSHLLQDITDERTLAQTKTAFIAILSHSLRTPLNGIKWAMESLTKEKLSPAEQQPVFAQIATQESMMENMVEGLVLASEIQKGEMSYKMESMDLTEVVRQAASFHEAAAKKKKLTFAVALPKKATMLKGDRIKLKIALSNIIENAVKYTDKGAVTINVTESKQGAAVSVHDTGIGIPKEQVGRLFSKFFWAKNAIMHQHEGAGMGLYIAKQIIDKHAGTITVSSEPNKGTTVAVMLKN